MINFLIIFKPLLFWWIRCNMIWKTRNPSRNKWNKLVHWSEISLTLAFNIVRNCLMQGRFFCVHWHPSAVKSLMKKKSTTFGKILPRRVPRFASYWLRPWQYDWLDYFMKAKWWLLGVVKRNVVQSWPTISREKRCVTTLKTKWLPDLSQIYEYHKLLRSRIIPPFNC